MAFPFTPTRDPAQSGARGMKIVATGLLVLMAALYFSARAGQDAIPALAWVEAFAEAAMVGGLADWFAVTALFRHPLGLPIPHTAIIPRNKDRIGDTLANFLQENFLTPQVVARRMQRMDLAGAAGRFLKTPDGEEGRLKQGASRMIADMVESLDDERLGGIAKSALSSRLHALKVAPVIGRALAVAINEDRHLVIVDRAIDIAARTLDDNESVIRNLIHQRASWVLRLAALDDKLADAILNGLRNLFKDMKTDLSHPVRLKLENQLADIANDLQDDAELQARVEKWKNQLLENPSINLWLDDLWQKGRASMIAAARNPDAAMAGKLGEVVLSLGQTLESDERLKRALNQFGRRAVVGAVSSYGSGIVKLVSETVKGWDATTITGRLENAVGRDLQYIRINGTLVGGLVGVTLHALHYIGL